MGLTRCVEEGAGCWRRGHGWRAAQLGTIPAIAMPAIAIAAVAIAAIAIAIAIAMMIFTFTFILSLNLNLRLVMLIGLIGLIGLIVLKAVQHELPPHDHGRDNQHACTRTLARHGGRRRRRGARG